MNFYELLAKFPLDAGNTTATVPMPPFPGAPTDLSRRLVYGGLPPPPEPEAHCIRKANDRPLCVYPSVCLSKHGQKVGPPTARGLKTSWMKYVPHIERSPKHSGLGNFFSSSAKYLQAMSPPLPQPHPANPIQHNKGTLASYEIRLF